MTLLLALLGFILRTKALYWAGLVMLWLASTAFGGPSASMTDIQLSRLKRIPKSMHRSVVTRPRSKIKKPYHSSL